MRPTAMDYFGDMDDQGGSTMAMDVDDVDSLEIFGGDGVIGENKLADLDFFNSFQDDFDESDMTSSAATTATANMCIFNVSKEKKFTIQNTDASSFSSQILFMLRNTQ